MSRYLNLVDYRTYDAHQLLVKLGLFVLSPFFAFLYSLKEAESRSSYVIFYLFGIVFCWNMTDRGAAHYDDFVGIMLRFQHTIISTSEIVKQFYDTISFSPQAPKELFENLLIWFTKQYSRNYHLYFAFASILYLAFMLGSLRKITSNEKFVSNFWGLLILMLFVLPRDIITVQNPRFTIGLWFNIFCTLSFFLGKSRHKWLYLLLICCSPFFHSGMWFYVIVFGICYLVVLARIRQKLCIVLFYVSIPFSFLSYELLGQINFSLLPIPDSLAHFAIRYMSSDSYDIYVGNKGASGYWWIQAFFNLLTTIAYSLIPLFLWKHRDCLQSDKGLNNFFSFFLLLSAVINFIQSVPVVGTRFYWMFRILAIYFWFRMVFPQHNKYLLCILFACSWYIFRRYFYGGAVSVCVPPDMWHAPLPVLITNSL